MQIKAAVVAARSAPFVIETLELVEPRADELIVRVVASGMCQTDLHGRDGYYAVTSYPAVFGHEGAGVVHAVGSAVREFAPGDHVVMSYPWCGECAHCRRQRLNYCLNARNLKNKGTRADGSMLLAQNGAPVYGAFFQQSSFGTFALTQARHAVKVRSDAPLDLIGPLACSGQTGAGAVLNVLKPQAGESLAVFGAGAVGLSALMAAKTAGCTPLVAVDVHAHRLDLARELGATDTIDAERCGDVAAEIRKVSGGGVHYAVDTSAVPKALREAIEIADAWRDLRPPRQCPRRHRGRVRNAVPAAGPRGARRGAGRQRTARVHSASDRLDARGQVSAGEDGHFLRFGGDQSRRG